MLTITTARLSIVPLNGDELRALISRYRDAVPELSTAYQEMLDSCLADPQNAVWYTAWKICLSAGMQEIGYAGFKGVHDGHVEIGYGVNEGYEGQGYATEAVAGLCRWALSRPEITVIEAESEADNYASQKVLLKNGFTASGRRGTEGPRYILRKAPQQR